MDFVSILRYKGVLLRNVCVSVLCENITPVRVLDLRSMSVCVCLGNIKKNGWKLNSWSLENKSSKHHWRKTRIHLCMTLVKQKCSSALPLSASKISPSIFPRIGNREQSNVDRFACNLVKQEKSPDLLVFWSEGFAWTIYCLRISDVYFYNVFWFITSGNGLR